MDRQLALETAEAFQAKGFNVLAQPSPIDPLRYELVCKAKSGSTIYALDARDIPFVNTLIELG